MWANIMHGPDNTSDARWKQSIDGVQDMETILRMWGETELEYTNR